MVVAFAVWLAVQPATIERTALVENASVVCARLWYPPGAAETPHTPPP